MPAQPSNSEAGDQSRASSLYSDFVRTAQQRRLTRTDKIIAQTELALVAIDISKARHEVLIAAPRKKRRRRISILNQLDDFKSLIASLTSYSRPVRVAFEATGNYHRAIRPMSGY